MILIFWIIIVLLIILVMDIIVPFVRSKINKKSWFIKFPAFITGGFSINAVIKYLHVINKAAFEWPGHFGRDITQQKLNESSLFETFVHSLSSQQITIQTKTSFIPALPNPLTSPTIPLLKTDASLIASKHTILGTDMALSEIFKIDPHFFSSPKFVPINFNYSSLNTKIESSIVGKQWYQAQPVFKSLIIQSELEIANAPFNKIIVNKSKFIGSPLEQFDFDYSTLYQISGNLILIMWLYIIFIYRKSIIFGLLYTTLILYTLPIYPYLSYCIIFYLNYDYGFDSWENLYNISFAEFTPKSNQEYYQTVSLMAAETANYLLFLRDHLLAQPYDQLWAVKHVKLALIKVIMLWICVSTNVGPVELYYASIYIIRITWEVLKNNNEWFLFLDTPENGIMVVESTWGILMLIHKTITFYVSLL